MDLGWPEILLILVVILIVFGVGKLPQVAGQLGKGIREFRKGARGDLGEEEQSTKAGANSTKQITGSSTEQSMQAELQATKARLEAAEAKLKELEKSAKKA